MNEKAILLVSAGLLSPKKANSLIARKHLYINFGLLGLGSILFQNGYQVTLVHGNYKKPFEVVSEFKDLISTQSSYPLFLSIPSFFALGWAREFCNNVKSLNSNIKIVVGGRWVTSADRDWLLRKLPNVDLFVYGTSEDIITSLITPSKWCKIANTSMSNFRKPIINGTILPDLEYPVMQDFHDYTPSIEVSRGCIKSCSFCLESKAKIILSRSPESLIDQIKRCHNFYSDKNINFYFEASCFTASLKWAEKFSELYAKNKLTSLWRCETRVDTISHSVLSFLAKAGLKIIDLGLESACPEQLINMGKTSNPQSYLNRASTFLKKCKDYGVWPKLNILLYPGENKETIQQTLDWLELHRGYIKGLSVGPFILFKGPYDLPKILDHIYSLGGNLESRTSLEKNGYSRLHLSREIGFDEAIGLSLKISKAFMSSRDYYDLKAFNYFPRNFNYKSFTNLIKNSDQKLMPFSYK